METAKVTLLLLFVTVSFGLIVRQSVIERRRTRRLLNEFGAACEALGLKKRFAFSSEKFQGVVQGVPVTAWLEASRRMGPLAWFAQLTGLPKDLGIRKAHWYGTDVPRVKSGDDTFDLEWTCTGPESLVRACTGPKLRALIRDHGFGTQEGEVLLTGGLELKTLSGRIQSTAKVMAAINAAARDIPRALRESVLEEPAARTRLRCLTLLLKEFPESMECEVARQAALASKDDALRALAIRSGKDDAAAVALEARIDDISLPVDERVDDVARRAALPPSATFARALRRILTEAELPLKRAAVNALGAMRDHDSFEAVGALVASEDPQLASEAVHAMARIGGTDAEPRLVALVTSGDSNVQQSAIEAIGETGSERGLEALEAAHPAGPQRKALETARREAVNALRERLPRQK